MAQTFLISQAALPASQRASSQFSHAGGSWGWCLRYLWLACGCVCRRLSAAVAQPKRRRRGRLHGCLANSLNSTSRAVQLRQARLLQPAVQKGTASNHTTVTIHSLVHSAHQWQRCTAAGASARGVRDGCDV